MPEAVVPLTDAQNAFVKQAGERKRMRGLLAPLEAQIKALEDRVAKLETKKAPKGEEK